MCVVPGIFREKRISVKSSHCAHKSAKMKLTILVTVTVLVCSLGRVQGQSDGATCNPQFQQGLGYPDPSGNDCSAFYRCDIDRWILYRCAIGLVFNNNTQNCDFPTNYPACNRATTYPGQLVAVSQTSCVMPCSSNVDFVVPMLTATSIDCTGFYVCQGGQLYEGRCSSIGSGFMYFDTFTRTCSRKIDDWNFNCAYLNKKRRRRRRR